MNGGTCNLAGQTIATLEATCVCASGFSGVLCQTAGSSPPPSPPGAAACGSTVSNSGTVSDGAGPYGMNQDCIWYLQCTTGSPVLEFSAFDTEGNYDWVSVFDGGRMSAPQLLHTSGSTLPAVQRATGSSMTVEFQTDASVVKEGIVASFSCDAPGRPPPPSPSPTPTSSGVCNGGRVSDLARLRSPLSGDTSGSGDNYEMSCGGAGNETIFSIELQPGQSIDIGMDSNTYDSRHETSWGGDCPGQTVVACTDDPDTVRHQWTNDQGRAQNVFFVIDAYSSGSGTFALSWTLTGGGGGVPTSIACSDFVEFSSATETVTNDCCDADHQCTAGIPSACSPECALVLIPFQDACHDYLGQIGLSSNVQAAVALCQSGH